MLHKLLSQKSFRVYFFICLLAIEYLATTSVHISVVESMWDKSNHFIAFFTLYVLLSFAFRNFALVKKVGVLLAFGFQIEVVQQLIGRSMFSWLDIVADSVGILLGVIAYFIFMKRFSTQS